MADAAPRASSTSPASTPKLTIEHSVALALLHHPTLAAFAWDVRVREGTALQASLLPNPSIQFDLENFAGSGFVSGFDQTEATVWLTQPVWLGGKRRKRRTLADLRVELAGWDYETARLDVLTETRRRFVDVLVADARLALAGKTYDLAAEVLDSVRRRVDAGRVSSAELGKAEVALTSARIDRERSASGLERSKALLAEMWGGQGPTVFDVDGALAVGDGLPSVAALVGGLGNAPEIARWDTELAEREAVVRVAEASAIPNLRVSAGYRRLEGTGDNAMVFSSSVPLPLVDRKQGNVLSARYAVARAREDRRRAVSRQRAQLIAAYARAEAAAETVRSLETRSLPAAQRAFATMSAGYRGGRFSYLDVLDAQRTLFAVRADLVAALGGYRTRRLELERLIAAPLSAAGAAR